MSNTNSKLKTYKKYKLLLKISNAIWNDNEFRNLFVFASMFSESLAFWSFTVLSHFGGRK